VVGTTVSEEEQALKQSTNIIYLILEFVIQKHSVVGEKDVTTEEPPVDFLISNLIRPHCFA